MLKESTLLRKGIYVFINVSLTFDIVLIEFSRKILLGNAPDLRQIILVLIFAMCSAYFTCGNGSTIQSLLRELLLTVNLWAFE